MHARAYVFTHVSIIYIAAEAPVSELLCGTFLHGPSGHLNHCQHVCGCWVQLCKHSASDCGVRKIAAPVVSLCIHSAVVIEQMYMYTYINL